MLELVSKAICPPKVIKKYKKKDSGWTWGDTPNVVDGFIWLKINLSMFQNNLTSLERQTKNASKLRAKST